MNKSKNPNSIAQNTSKLHFRTIITQGVTRIIPLIYKNIFRMHIYIHVLIVFFRCFYPDQPEKDSVETFINYDVIAL